MRSARENESTRPPGRILASRLLFNEQNTVRAGWRIMLFFFVFVVLLIFLTGLAFLSLGPILARDFRIGIFANGFFSAIAATVAAWVAGRVCEQLPLKALGITFDRSSLRSLAVGFAFGVIAYSGAALIAVLFGDLSFALAPEINIYSVFRSWAIAAILLSAPAAFEEILFRGYILQTLIRSRMAIFAILFTSALFAAVHGLNPNVSNLALVNTFLAGIWFSTAYLLSRNLWLPFGLHFAWNWTQVAVFGSELSGFGRFVHSSLFFENDAGPDWLTGGTYGIEGGIACSIVMIIAIAVNILYVTRNSRWWKESSKVSGF